MTHMRRCRYGSFLLGSVVLGALASCAPLLARPQAPPPVGLDEIIRMSQDGVPDSEIIERIRSSRVSYRLSAEEVVALHEAGVSARVIDDIQDAYIDRMRREQELTDRAYLFNCCWWGYADPRFYWWYNPLPCYPFPY